MRAAPALCLAFVAVGAVAALSLPPGLADVVRLNAAVQIGWFALAAVLPFLLTGRMSWVDVAWPFGVAWFGLVLLVEGPGDPVRTAVAGGAYLLIGLRMGIGAVVMAAKTGVIIRSEFPRYRYSRDVLERSGARYVRLHMLLEMVAQGLANASVLALPGLLLASSTGPLSGWELAGLVLTATGYAIESVADGQKMLFIARTEDRRAVCDVGLWRYSRHPNYFGEWLVWTGLVVAAVPGWWALGGDLPAWPWAALGLGTLGASATMYLSLVHLTGAVPAEHFSAQKRPGYRAYQQRTSRFVPWLPRVEPPAPGD